MDVNIYLSQGSSFTSSLHVCGSFFPVTVGFHSFFPVPSFQNGSEKELAIPDCFMAWLMSEFNKWDNKSPVQSQQFFQKFLYPQLEFNWCPVCW